MKRNDIERSPDGWYNVKQADTYMDFIEGVNRSLTKTVGELEKANRELADKVYYFNKNNNLDENALKKECFRAQQDFHREYFANAKRNRQIWRTRFLFASAMREYYFEFEAEVGKEKFHQEQLQKWTWAKKQIRHYFELLFRTSILIPPTVPGKAWIDVKKGDVIDGCTITQVSQSEYDINFTFDLPDGGWSFLVIYPKQYNETAKIHLKEPHKEPEADDD